MKWLMEILKVYVKQELQELHKTIIRKLGKAKVYSSFKDKTWGADLADMQFISTFRKRGSFFMICCLYLL